MKITTVRLPDKVYEEIKNTSEQNKRSVNAEINYRLEKILQEKENQNDNKELHPSA